MAAPNIVSVSTIYGKTTALTPSTISPTVLLANDASSNKVVKINTILATNIDGTDAIECTVAYNTVANGSGTSSSIVSTVTVPANASLVVLDKSSSLYLEEDKSIVVTSGIASKITYIISYEEIS